MIYLDHNAATPMRPQALSAVEGAQRAFGNPSSVHAAGRAARDLLDEARIDIALSLRVRQGDLVLTSGATEAAALAVRGALGAAKAGRRRLVVTAVEHPCVLGLARSLEREGTPLTVVPVGRDGQLDLEAFRAALGPDVALACAMWANNETGVVFPVKELALLCREVGAPLFCDAAQAAGKVPLHLDDLAADLVAITGEKLGGPRGTGALFVTPGLRLSPLLGGEQERGRRGGTENPPGAAGLAAALKVAAREQPLEAERLGRLRDLFEQGLQSALPFARVNAKGAPRLSSTSSITFPGTDGEALLMALDLSGLCASAGSACHSGSTSPSPVLLAMGMPEEEARATLRFSFGWTTTQAEVDLALELIPPIVRRVKDAIPAAS